MKAETTPSTDKLLRKKQVAEKLACSTKTVEREMKEGHLTRVKVRGCVCFRESEVNAIINRQKP
jgi:excisionase family DNA binding protein